MDGEGGGITSRERLRADPVAPGRPGRAGETATAATPAGPAAPGQSLLRLRAVWYLILGWTVAYGVGSWLLEWGYSQAGALRPMPFVAGSKGAIYALVWAPLLLAAVWLADRWPVRSFADGGRIALHLAAAVAAPFVWGTAAYTLCMAWVPGWQPWGFGRMYLSTATGVLYVYTVVEVIAQVALRVRGNREREVAALRAAEAATQAQLHVLAMELQPHFLFNALHAVSSLMHSDRAAAVRAMRELRELLHYGARTAAVTEVSLAEELRALEMYTRVQELRFGDRLRLRWTVPEEVRGAAVPHFLLQPLVENAIKFSVESLSGTGQIVVEAARVDAELVVRVADDGIGVAAAGRGSEARGFGRGLANARERLWHLYGTRQQLTLRPSARGHGTVVEVRLPFRDLGREMDRPRREMKQSATAVTAAVPVGVAGTP